MSATKEDLEIDLDAMADSLRDQIMPATGIPDNMSEADLIADQLATKQKMLNQVSRKTPDQWDHTDFNMTEEEFTRQYRTPISPINLISRRGVDLDHVRGPEYKKDYRTNVNDAVSTKLSQELSRTGYITDKSEIEVDIDIETGIDAESKALLSTAETPEEFNAAFRELHPRGAIFSVPVKQPKVAYPNLIGERNPAKNEIIYKHDVLDPDEPFKTMKTDDFRLSDIASAAGALPEITASILTAFATSGQSLWMQAAAQGGAVAAGGLAEEGLEELFGLPQLETAGEVFGRTGKEGATAALFALALGGGGKLVKGFSQSDIAGELATKYRNAVDVLAKETGMNKAKAAELLMFHDLADHPIVERLSQQALSTTRSFQHQMRTFMSMPAQGLSRMRSYGGSQPGAVSESVAKAHRNLQNSASRQYEAMKGQLKSKLAMQKPSIGAPDPKKAQQVLQQETDKFISNTQKVVSGKWNKIGNFAAKNKLRFDLSELQRTAKEVKGRWVGATGKPQQETIPTQTIGVDGKPLAEIETVTSQAVNVAEDITMQMDTILDDILAISKTQTNHAAVDSLRKRIGGLYERAQSAGVNAGDINRLYRAASTVLRNPSNLSKEGLKTYQSTVDDAFGAAKARFEMIGLGQTRAILNSDNKGEIIEAFARPNGIAQKFGDDVFNSKVFKDMFPEEQLDIVRQSAKARILANRNPMETLRLFREKDKQGFNILFPDTKSYNAFRGLAQKAVDLHNSPIAAAANASSPRAGALKILRDKNVSASTINKYVDSMDDVGRENLRLAIYDDLLDRATTTPKALALSTSDDLVIDAKKMTETINQYKTTGLWNSKALTASDRKVIDGMTAYARLNSVIGTDVGVTLEAAQAITQLKSVLNPLQMLSGVHKLGANKFIAMAMQSKTMRKLFVNFNDKVKVTGETPAGIKVTGSGPVVNGPPAPVVAAILTDMESFISENAENARDYNEILFSTLEEQGIANRSEIMQAVRDLQEVNE